MTADALTCREFVELVTEYLEGTLPEDERRRFEEHLALCPGCHTYLLQMRDTIAVAGQLSEDSIGPEAERALLSVFREWKTVRKDL